jgi:nitrogen fixation protein NifU and related proteins
MSMQSLYQDLILEHAKRPHGVGLREPFDVEVHHVNPTCGDEVRLRVRLDGDRLDDVSYESLGCSISVAGASVMAQSVTGGSVADAMARYDDVVAMMHARNGSEPDPELLGDAVAFAGVAKFPARVKCALLGWAAMRDAVLQAVGTTREMS